LNIIKNDIMTPRIYILKEDIKQYVVGEKEEITDAKNQIKWGMKSGIISLITDLRTTTTYWEL